MPSVKALILTSLSCVSNWIGSAPRDIQSAAYDLSQSGSQQNIQAPSKVVVVAIPPEFRSVLSSLPTETLHSVLHSHLPHFKDGIFEKDSRAVEEIYKRSPEMANQLVAAARYDVLRRQNGNITTTARPPVSSVTPITTPITLTQTDAQGGVFVSTFTPVGGVFTSQVIQTSTLADGTPTTFTSITVIPAPTQSASSSQPRLQNGAESTLFRDQSVMTLSGVLMVALSFAGFLLA